MIEIFVDADACPVKDEIYVVGARYGLRVVIVANQRMAVPEDLGAVMVHVEQGPDVADDWIVEHIQPSDVVVTGDLPLAARCLQGGAHVLGSTGRVFDSESIGDLLATRSLKEHIRETGVQTGGPAPLSTRDRSRFSQKLDELVQRGIRELESR